MTGAEFYFITLFPAPPTETSTIMTFCRVTVSSATPRTSTWACGCLGFFCCYLSCLLPSETRPPGWLALTVAYTRTPAATSLDGRYSLPHLGAKERRERLLGGRVRVQVDERVRGPPQLRPHRRVGLVRRGVVKEDAHEARRVLARVVKEAVAERGPAAEQGAAPLRRQPRLAAAAVRVVLVLALHAVPRTRQECRTRAEAAHARQPAEAQPGEGGGHGYSLLLVARASLVSEEIGLRCLLPGLLWRSFRAVVSACKSLGACESWWRACSFRKENDGGDARA